MHGLSTLNRLLGKKNKEVSRSTSNLSKSHSSNLESSSQQNIKIPILQHATPFEQTFRVTVYLPKNQLYVERIGAKTKLERLMSDVCDSKNLSIDKYEFRHPTDMSQVFDKQKTIGEVGLNELRLVLKTESRFNSDFHRYHSQPDELMKYKSSTVPESVSSSEISRSNLKNVSKTSPYSSTNSLNSLDSTGMNSSNKTQQPVAPIRKKKRMAPRPPSENSIPEQEIFSTSTLNVFKEPHSILPRKNFHVSSPQLYNNNYEISPKSDSNNNNTTELRTISSRLNAITRPSSLHISNHSTETVKNLPDRQRNNSESSEIQNILRESGSKQNSLERTKKKSPAPIPPTRKVKPTPSPRTIQEMQEEMKVITEIKEVDEQENVTQKAVGEIPSIDNNNQPKSSKSDDENGNVSKVLLLNNNESPPSLETEGPISIQILSSEINVEKQKQQQQQSVKLPVVSKVHINQNNKNENCRDNETRSGSEEEEMTVNIYNVTKSVVTCEKPTIIKETNNKKISVIEEKHVVIENNNIIVKEETIKTEVVQEEFRRSPSPQWTYTLPAPPIVGTIEISNDNNSPTDHQKSVDGNKYFSDYTSTVNDNETILSDNTTVVSAETHIQPIINDRRKALDDSFIINSNDYTKQIVVVDNQSDKSGEVITSDLEDGYLGNNNKNDVNNPSKDNEISEISENVSSPKIIIESNSEKEIIVEDFQKSRLIMSRSDSFHSIGQQKRNDYEITKRSNMNALPQRSTSFLSLVNSHKAEMKSSSMNDANVPYNRQKSTSELSISDVPSLQSIEVIKNILNCRKTSLQDTNINTNDNSALSDEIIKNKNAPNVESTSSAKNISSTTITTEKVIYNAIEKRDIQRKLETQKSEPVVEYNKNNNNNNSSNKKSETQWRYSGPPKINFSTWNERPIAKVSVMSDEDYIFGGVSAAANSTTLPRDFNNKNHQQQHIDSQNDSVDSFVKRNNYTVIVTKENNKEAERHLPKVLGVEYKKDVNPVMLRNNEPSSEIISNNNNSKTLISIKQRPATLDYSSTISSSTKTISSPNYQSQFVSYNRLTTNLNNINNNNNNNNINSNNNNNNKKFTPVVHGFAKLDNISETQADVKSLPITNKIIDKYEKKPEAPIIPVKPSYLRSTSAGDINRNAKLSQVKIEKGNDTNSHEDEDEKPFSSTLRRTGLIEKMLNNDKKTESMFGRVLDKPKNSTSTNQVNYNFNEEKIEKTTARQLSQPISSVSIPPPPPPMIFRKSAPAGEISNDLDTRNQLLDAIKNFNKDSLRRK